MAGKKGMRRGVIKIPPWINRALTKDEINEKKHLYEQNGYYYKKPDDWFQRGNEKIYEEGLENDDGSKKTNPNEKYQSWYCDLEPDDIESLSNEELDKLIYDYKAKKHLYNQETKNDKFNGKYKY